MSKCKNFAKYNGKQPEAVMWSGLAVPPWRIGGKRNALVERNLRDCMTLNKGELALASPWTEASSPNPGMQVASYSILNNTIGPAR